MFITKAGTDADIVIIAKLSAIHAHHAVQIAAAGGVLRSLEP